MAKGFKITDLNQFPMNDLVKLKQSLESRLKKVKKAIRSRQCRARARKQFY